MKLRILFTMLAAAVAFPVLAAAVALPVVAADGPRSLRLDPLVAMLPDAARPGLVEAGIRWGTITVRGHDAPEIRVEPSIEVDAGLAARLRDADIRERVAIRLVERPRGLEVVVDAALDGFYGVDLVVWVPRDTSLGLEVRDGGEITVDDVAGEIDIANRNGSVDLSRLAGAAVVHARNGSIRADFRSVPDDAPMAFSSLNGSVDVTFPDAPSADVRIRYNRGGVESDFAIVSLAGEAAADTAGLDGRATRLLEGRIGAGGPRYHFHTANGTVYLRRADDRP